MPNLSSTAVYQILNNYLGTFVPNEIFNLITVIADQGYLTVPSLEWFRDKAVNDPIVSPKKYKRDIFDCDDYVMYIKTRLSLYAANNMNINRPFAAGFLLTENHAFNFSITDTNHLCLLNTQSDNFDAIIPQSISECAHFLGLANNNVIKFIYI